MIKIYKRTFFLFTGRRWETRPSSDELKYAVEEIQTFASKDIGSCVS